VSEAPARSGFRRWAWSLPLVAFLGLAGLFWLALAGGDPHRLPSALIGKHVPQFTLQPIEGLAGDTSFSSADLAAGKATIVNVWASWCVPCREEHTALLDLSKQPGIRLFGINYKDDPEAARRFLGRFGDPYARLGADPSGRVAINWGVYGVPETYIVDGKGIVTYRHIGPLTPAMIQTELLPRLNRAEQKLSEAAKAQP
jgi:cytochrome c biogenesis protein CcmG, thiol:disulfide interchange protein DsbE